MKSILCLCFMFSYSFVTGQGLRIQSPPNYPCTDSVLNRETVFLCADNKTYCFLNFRASYENDHLFITASRPDSSSMFPVFNLFVTTKGIPGVYVSEHQNSNLYGTFRPGGAHDLASNVHNGSCQVTLNEFTSHFIKGHFVMTAFDPWGSKGKLISGSFYIKLKKV